jgi:hypothetical protein
VSAETSHYFNHLYCACVALARRSLDQDSLYGIDLARKLGFPAAFVDEVRATQVALHCRVTIRE